MGKTNEQKLEQVKVRYAYWNKENSPPYMQSTPCGTNCSDIGTDCHGDGECGGDAGTE